MTLVRARLLLGGVLLTLLLAMLSVTGALGAAWRAFERDEAPEQAAAAVATAAPVFEFEGSTDIGPAEANEYIARFNDRAFLLRLSPDGRGGYTGTMFWAVPGDSPGAFRRIRYGVSLVQFVERPGSYTLAMAGQLHDARFSGDLLIVQMPVLEHSPERRTYVATFTPGTRTEFDEASRRAEQFVRSRTGTPGPR